MSCNIERELTELEQRKRNLLKLKQLRNEVSILEIEIMDTTTPSEAIKIVADEVCKAYGITFARLSSPGRPRAITLPRQIAFFLLRTLRGIPLETIGQAFRKDHGTVMHGCKTIKNLLDTDKQLAGTVEAIKKACEKRFVEMSNPQTDKS